MDVSANSGAISASLDKRMQFWQQIAELATLLPVESATIPSAAIAGVCRGVQPFPSFAIRKRVQSQTQPVSEVDAGLSVFLGLAHPDPFVLPMGNLIPLLNHCC